jgi:tRNA nucleotidyltransferase (CCA-adding enzyme)
MKDPFKKPLAIVERLLSNGHEAYFVGGSVRDLLLKRDIGDIDIATSARPSDVQNLFSKTIDVGAAHGTIIVLHEGTPYEVTTFRSEENYKDFRRPDQVTFILSLEEDLKRRDFTMNAIAMSIKGEFIDPFNGQEAIEQKYIQTVGDPYERFKEDALRMFRAIRFVSQLGFEVVEETKLALAKYSYLLEKISVERLTVELEKLLMGTYTEHGILLLTETRIYKYLPGLHDKKEHLFKSAKYQWNLLHEKSEYWTLLLYLLEVKDSTSFLKQWKLPNKIIKQVDQNLKGIEKVKTEGWSIPLLYNLGIENAVQVERVMSILANEKPELRLEKIVQLFVSLPIKERSELRVKGEDLLAWSDKAPGQWIANCIENVEEAVLTGKIENDKQGIKEWLVRCNLL